MNFHHVAAGLLSYVFQSGLLLAVGLILPRALRVRHPRTMLVYWRLLLLVVLLLPLLTAVWQPKAPLPTLVIDGLTVEAVVATALPAVVHALDWRIVIWVVAVVALLALLRLVVGLAPDGSEIFGIKVVEHLETPGLGNKIESPWADQFKGKAATAKLKVEKRPPAAANEIQAITGATWSSRYVTDIVNDVIKKMYFQTPVK